MSRVADIDIEPAVIIDVDEYDACAPHAILAKPCFVGDVFEGPVAFVEEELVTSHIGGEEDIRKAIVVDIPDGHSAAVVKIAEEEAIIFLAVCHVVAEFDTGVGLQLEQRVIIASVRTGRAGQQKEE